MLQKFKTPQKLCKSFVSPTPLTPKLLNNIPLILLELHCQSRHGKVSTIITGNLEKEKNLNSIIDLRTIKSTISTKTFCTHR